MLDPKEVLFGLSIKHIAEACAVDLTTARRWKRGAICPPQSALWVLTGDLGHLDPAWTGWKLSRGCLCSPENWLIYVNDVLAVPLLRLQLAAYQSENRALKRDLADAEANRLEEQPLADDWAIPANWVISEAM
jgi:hypothetical protein